MFNTNNKFFIDKVWKKLLNESSCRIPIKKFSRKLISNIERKTAPNDKITMLKKNFDFNMNYSITNEMKDEFIDPITKEKITYVHGNPVNKPLGLWYAEGTNWINHCFDPDNYMKSFMGEYIYKIEIEEKKILNVSKSGGYDEIIDNFIFKKPYPSGKFVDWGPIMEKYAGVYFKEFVDDLSGFSFHNSLDIWPTGCIWNLKSGIKAVYEWKINEGDINKGNWNQIF